MLLAELPPWFVLLTAVSVGLCFGSFLNVVIYRLPRGMSVATPPSSCPACGARIRARDNVPVFGWLFLGGKARCCGAPVSAKYPLVEALGGLIAGAIVMVHLLPAASELDALTAVLLFSLYLALGLGLVALTFIDLEFMILPDSLTLGGAALGFVSTFVRADLSPLESLLGAAVGFVGLWFPFIWLHQKLRGFPGMGLGDAKLVLLAGAWFGPWGTLFTLFAGALQGTLAALVVLLVKGKVEEPARVREELEELRRAIEETSGEEREELERLLAEDPLAHEAGPGFGGARIAFGPFLALACLELLFFQGPIRWFLSTTFGAPLWS